MLASSQSQSPRFGFLSQDVHKPREFLYEVLDFIAEQLPLWRDDPERPREQAETLLTEFFRDHLDWASRMSNGFDILHFGVESADELQRSRKIDISIKPCCKHLYIDGRGYNKYEILLPIECKRLPTPIDGRRDQREYVISAEGSTGGIQRFKAGHHGAAHELGAMIGYVQEGTGADWHDYIREWIQDLINSEQAGWTAEDFLLIEEDREDCKLTILNSTHSREGNSNIKLRHLWIGMN